MTATIRTAVPTVTIIENGRRIRVLRPAKGHTFDFPTGESDPETLAAYLRGALADAFHAGRIEAQDEA